jgi:hypothetical protein
MKRLLYNTEKRELELCHCFLFHKCGGINVKNIKKHSCCVAIECKINLIQCSKRCEKSYLPLCDSHKDQLYDSYLFLKTIC